MSWVPLVSHLLNFSDGLAWAKVDLDVLMTVQCQPVAWLHQPSCPCSPCNRPACYFILFYIILRVYSLTRQMPRRAAGQCCVVTTLSWIGCMSAIWHPWQTGAPQFLWPELTGKLHLFAWISISEASPCGGLTLGDSLHRWEELQMQLEKKRALLWATAKFALSFYGPGFFPQPCHFIYASLRSLYRLFKRLLP